MLKALIVEVKGTLDDIDGAHRDALNTAFIDVGCASCLLHFGNPDQLMFQDQDWVDLATLHQWHNNTLSEAA